MFHIRKDVMLYSRTPLLLALLFAVPNIQCKDLDQTITISSIAAIASLFGFGIYEYKQYADQARVEDAVTHLKNQIEAIRYRRQAFTQAWKASQQNSHHDRIQALAANSDTTSFQKEEASLATDKKDLNSAYNRVSSLNDLHYYPNLQQQFDNQLQPEYHNIHSLLSSIDAFLRKHRNQLTAHDTIYRNDKLIQYYDQPSSDKLIQQFTNRYSGWPRIEAVEQLQEYQEKLNHIYAQLDHEKFQHASDAYEYDVYLLQLMQHLHGNLMTSCNNLSNSREYDIERERYRNNEQHRQIEHLYHNQIRAEQEKKYAENRHAQAAEDKARAIENHQKQVERAQRLYEQLIKSGSSELPEIRRKIADALQRLDEIKKAYVNNNRPVQVEDFQDLRQRLNDVQKHIPDISREELNTSFTMPRR